ncbi:hypothetical protein niasHT_009872 [Heterodera trifolii]|uniref:Insulin-like domain-containing protein n=1 Tax=Heterodera trifolii TaxID=157864 RepID=A0ABD2MD23_9BILA
MRRTSSSICPFSSSFHVLLRPVAVFIAAVCAVVLLSSADVEAFVRRPDNGIMKLCPPGGQSFAAAWEITCGMRRRKRDASATERGANANDGEQQQMNEGNHEGGRGPNDAAESADNRPGERRTNGTTTKSATVTPPMPHKSWWKSFGEVFFGLPSQIGRADEENAMASAADGIDDKQLYRAPSMTEMMRFCCRFGCSLRDLLPYCDPFGEWDS